MDDPAEICGDVNTQLQFVIRGDEKDLKLEAESETIKGSWLRDLRRLVEKMEAETVVSGLGVGHL